jgi:hypothetical protein
MPGLKRSISQSAFVESVGGNQAQAERVAAQIHTRMPAILAEDQNFCRMSQCYPGGQWVSEGRAEIWNRCLSLLVPDLAGKGFVWFCVKL